MKKSLFLILAICILLGIGVCAVPTAVGGDFEFDSMLASKPEKNATADEVVTLAARLHSLLYGGSITESSDVENCYTYAEENGIIFDGLFETDNTSEYEISRAELAYILSKALGTTELEKINDVLFLPDSDVTALYYEPALMLINAGVMEGIDEYGSFGPTQAVKRYELNEILARLTNEEGRIEREYLEYASDEPFYLINDYLMGDTTAIRGIYNIGSGWRYDYTGSSQKAPWTIGSVDGARNGYVNTLRDLSTTDNITISREIFPQRDGELVLEASFNITFGFAGFRLFLEDIDGNNIFEMRTNSSYLLFDDFYGTGRSRYLSSKSGDRRYYLRADPERANDNSGSQYRISDQIRLRMTINLDTGIVKVAMSGTNYYPYYPTTQLKLKDGYNGLKKIAFSTGVAEQIEYTVKQVHLYKNYRVNDKFITHKANVKPYDYTTYGDVVVQEIYTDSHNQGDFYSVFMHTRDGDDIYARKNFTKIGGIVKLETYLLLPTGDDGVYFNAGYDSNPVISVITHDGKFYTANKEGKPDKELRFFTPNCWQCIRIEADTNTQTALIKINGKVVAENVPFLVKTDAFNRIEIGCKEAAGDFEIWFDDVEVHELFYTPDDYVPKPVPLDTGNYILSMSVCNLWRNGSHYGWSYIEPHAEIQPITGYYDEGNAEAMDWEIKFLAEHGVSTYAMCWYAPTNPASVPIKKPRMVDAHHEGYFNAKYTEYLDFSIMWENASYGTPGTSEAFKENIFPFWMDWYFSDPRYFRIEEDGKEYLFLTIYKWAEFRNMCLPAKSGATASNTTSYYNNLEFNQAEVDAAKVVKWMEDQVIESGYADGIILCFTNNGSANTGNISMLNIAGSDTAIFPYAWGSISYDIDTQKQMVEANYELSQKASNSLVTEQTGAYKGSEQGLDLLALASVGFNDIGWAQRRFPLVSDEDFEEILEWYRDEYMPRFKDDEDSWKQYFIQFDTWNEYGEGHYIYPTIGLDPIPGTDYQGYGQYGYLEAMAKVFGQNYDSELHEELDITPTQEQKTRIGRLYVPNKRMYIRREFLPDSSLETPVPEDEVLSFKFNSKLSESLVTSVGGCYSQSNGKKYIYDEYEEALKLKSMPGTQNNPDPQIYFENSSAFSSFTASDCDMIHIRMKSSKTGSIAQVFFRVDTMPKNSSGSIVYSESYQYTFYLGEPDEWNDYYIDLRSHDGFTGKILSLRFDPCALEDTTIYLSEFELLKFSDEQKKPTITVDSHVYNPTDYWEIQEESRNEIYIAPTHDNNLYHALHIVYDWNENTGILDLDTPDGTTFRFTVGSDKVIVNGEQEVTLAKEFYVYDGAPVIPLLYILKTADYKYTYDYTGKKLDITVSDHVIYEDLPNNDAENEELKEAFYSLSDSALSIAEDSDDETNNVWLVTGGENSNSYFVTDFEFENSVKYNVSFDIKPKNLIGTTTMAQTYTVKLIALYSDGTQTKEYTMDIASANKQRWNHLSCEFTLPDDRVANGDIPEKIGIFMEPDRRKKASITFEVDNFIVKRTPSVFAFSNGDAEDEDMSMWYASNTYINRVWDDEMDSWVIELTPVPDSGSEWSYLRQKTKFETGVTYYYSFDAKMGVNSYGDPVATTFAINSRYDDLLQKHLPQNQSDHSVTYGNQKEISQADGWKHYTGSFTISMGRTGGGVVGHTDPDGVKRWYDEITWYINPRKVDGKNSPMSFRIDNIKFSTTPIE